MGMYGKGEIGAEIFEYSALIHSLNTGGRVELPSPGAYEIFHRGMYYLPDWEAETIREKFAHAADGAQEGVEGFRIGHLADFVSATATLTKDRFLEDWINRDFPLRLHNDLVFCQDKQRRSNLPDVFFIGHHLFPTTIPIIKDDESRVVLDFRGRNPEPSIDYNLLSGLAFLYLYYAVRDEKGIELTRMEHSYQRPNWPEYFSRPGIQEILPKSLPNRTREQKN